MNVAYDLLHPDGSRHRVVDLAPDRAGVSAVLIDLDPATRRLVDQRRRGERDARTGHSSGQLVRRLGLGSEDSESERGHFVWWPPGVRVRRALTEWLRRFHEVELGAEPVTTPLLRSWGAGSDLFDLAGGYNARLYGVESDHGREAILTYGGDPGYLALVGRSASPPEGPWRVHEQVLAHRRSQRGELGGLQRTRSFEFFDFHSLVPRSDGLAEYIEILGRQVGFVRRHGHGVAVETRVAAGDTEAVAALHRFAVATAQPVVLAVVDYPEKYYRLLHNLFDDNGLHTMHGQLDETNAERWRGPGAAAESIVHAASGTLERWLLVHLLDGETRTPPHLVSWLAPFHVSVVPVRAEHRTAALAWGREMSAHGVRVRVDDRDLSVGRRIRDSLDAWTPHTAVFGEHEASGGQVQVRTGGGESAPSLDVAKLIATVAEPLPTPLWPVTPPVMVSSVARWV